MAKKTRLIIFIFCIICFFIIAPLLVAYSMGYRIDKEAMKIVETGGIYVRTFPSADQIAINFKTFLKPGIFSNAIFVQSLLPKEHTVFIQKNGYFDYFKTLEVNEKEVTKLENVILIKKVLSFKNIKDEADFFSIAPNNQDVIISKINSKAINFSFFNLNSISDSKDVSIPITGKILEIKWNQSSDLALIKIQIPNNSIDYYLFESLEEPEITRISSLDKNTEQIFFSPQNSKTLYYTKNNTLYSLVDNKPKIILEDVISYSFFGNNIIWLSSEGNLSESDIFGKLINLLNKEIIVLNKNKNYKIENILGKIYLKEGDSLLIFNQNTKIFENFEGPNFDYEILHSPDGKNLIYWNKNKIYVYSFSKEKYEELFSGNSITNCQWLNNDYIIFSAEDNVIISEIDYRGNINSFILPEIIETENNDIIKIQNPQMFFIQHSGKAYILTNNTLLESEKILP